MKIPVLEGQKSILQWSEKKIPTDNALWWQNWWTYTSCGGRRLSWQHFSLQVDVLSGAGIFQMLLVVLLEGSSAENTDIWGLKIYLWVLDIFRFSFVRLFSVSDVSQCLCERHKNRSCFSQILVDFMVRIWWMKHFCPSCTQPPPLNPATESGLMCIFNYSNTMWLNNTWVILLPFNPTQVHKHMASVQITKKNPKLDYCQAFCKRDL